MVRFPFERKVCRPICTTLIKGQRGFNDMTDDLVCIKNIFPSLSEVINLRDVVPRYLQIMLLHLFSS